MHKRLLRKTNGRWAPHRVKWMIYPGTYWAAVYLDKESGFYELLGDRVHIQIGRTWAADFVWPDQTIHQHNLNDVYLMAVQAPSLESALSFFRHCADVFEDDDNDLMGQGIVDMGRIQVMKFKEYQAA